MVVYFTGTGNSRHCAQLAAQQLEDQLVDTFPLIRDGKEAELCSDKPWVFVSPTYAWQLPRVFSSFLRKCVLKGSREAYFIMTCGSEIGNAGETIEHLCQELGLHFRGVLQVVMPENYIALFDAPEEAEARRIVAAARPSLEAGIDCIKSGKPFAPVKVSMVDRRKSDVVNAYFYKKVIKDKAFLATEACVGCGRCAESCVQNNITMQDGNPVWGGRCIHCMACICGCPWGAIEYGKASVGRPRYQCPSHEAAEDTE